MIWSLQPSIVAQMIKLSLETALEELLLLHSQYVQKVHSVRLAQRLQQNVLLAPLTV